jgi:hypothetical protein
MNAEDSASAQVARYLSRALIELGHEVRLITGTLHDGGVNGVSGYNASRQILRGAKRLGRSSVS